MLHSTIGDRRMWDHQMRSFGAAGYGVIRCDLNGYGQSLLPAEPYNDADDVVALLDHLGVERVTLIGASGGGRVAIEVAARWPDRVQHLVLLCTAAADLEPGPELRAFATEEDALLAAGELDRAVDLNLRTWLQPEATPMTRHWLGVMQARAFALQSSPAGAGHLPTIERPTEMDRVILEFLG